MLHCPELDPTASLPYAYSQMLYVGTEAGVVSVMLTAEEATWKYGAAQLKLQALEGRPITAIRGHRQKPYRALVASKTGAVVVWNWKVGIGFDLDRQKNRTSGPKVEDSSVLDVQWAYGIKAIVLALASGNIKAYKLKALTTPLWHVQVARDPIERIFVSLRQTLPLTIVSFTRTGSTFEALHRRGVCDVWRDTATEGDRGISARLQESAGGDAEGRKCRRNSQARQEQGPKHLLLCGFGHHLRQ